MSLVNGKAGEGKWYCTLYTTAAAACCTLLPPAAHCCSCVTCGQDIHVCSFTYTYNTSIRCNILLVVKSLVNQFGCEVRLFIPLIRTFAAWFKQSSSPPGVCFCSGRWSCIFFSRPWPLFFDYSVTRYAPGIYYHIVHVGTAVFGIGICISKAEDDPFEMEVKRPILRSTCCTSYEHKEMGNGGLSGPEALYLVIIIW